MSTKQSITISIRQFINLVLVILSLASILAYLFAKYDDRCIKKETVLGLEVMISLLIIGFIFAFAWAWNLYISLKDELIFSQPESGQKVDANLQSSEEVDVNLQFHELAREHRQWSQLWFTISLCILFAGLMFALSQILWIIDKSKTGVNNECTSSLSWVSWGLVVNGFIADSYDKSPSWSVVVNDLIENFFVFSLFYLAWNWSVRHFRAHWHNFILNAYRYRSLGVLCSMIKDVEKVTPKDKRQLRELRKLST